MQNILKTINGKKTYIVSGVSAALGVVDLLTGHQYGQVLPYLFAGAFGASLRHAVAKVEVRALSALPAPVQEVVKPVVDAEVQKVEGQ